MACILCESQTRTASLGLEVSTACVERANRNWRHWLVRICRVIFLLDEDGDLILFFRVLHATVNQHSITRCISYLCIAENTVLEVNWANFMLVPLLFSRFFNDLSAIRLKELICGPNRKQSFHLMKPMKFERYGKLNEYWYFFTHKLFIGKLLIEAG